MNLLFSLLSAFSFAMDGGQKTPFPLLEKFSMEAIRYVPESRYYVPKEGEIPLVGPLNPCILIACRDEKKTVVFHKYYANSPKSIEEIIKKEFSEIKELEVFIFGTKISKDLEEEKKRPMNEFYETPLYLITGKTVQETIKDIKDHLIACGIKNTKASIWLLSNFIQAELFVAHKEDKNKDLKDTLYSIDIKNPIYLLQEKEKSNALYEKEESLEIEEWEKKYKINPLTSNEFARFRLYPVNKQ